MTGIDRIRPEFVELMPSAMAPGILYVSISFNTAIHLCCCGCGNRVVTPLAPSQWRLMYNGRDVSLYPSVGNWSYPCKSHYWIEEGNVEWAPMWDEQEIEAGREETRKAVLEDSGQRPTSRHEGADSKDDAHRRTPARGLWKRLQPRLGRSTKKRDG